jgi:hypothetical protein
MGKFYPSIVKVYPVITMLTYNSMIEKMAARRKRNPIMSFIFLYKSKVPKPTLGNSQIEEQVGIYFY